MRAHKDHRKEIRTIKELLMYSSYEESETSRTKENIRYVDVSPPLNEKLPKGLNTFQYWKKGKKADYESISAFYNSSETQLN